MDREGAPLAVKTNAARILDREGISYRLLEYEVDLDDLSAESVAAKVGLPTGRVFKTLVARGEGTGVGGSILLACVPAGFELDRKALARASGHKSIDLVPLKEVLPLTGYVRGGVSPIGAKKRFPVFVDESALGYETIAISAGVRGCQFLIAPADLIAVTGACVAAIAVHSGGPAPE